jgi:3-deoxy-D-manno-octulosonic acid kinase
MTPKTYSLNNISILHDADVAADFPPQFFEAAYWQQNGSYEGQAEEGKGTTIFVRDGEQSWAMRHYHRGGAVAWFLRDSYLWCGLNRSRPWREWHLLADLHQQGLPVPAPIAAQVVRSRFVYRADLVMSRIEHANVWMDWMRRDALSAQDWQALGQTLRRFHNADVYHHDLNINNILRTQEGEIYLIDFDKARIRNGGGYWKRQNLDRLQRSIDKQLGKGIELHFNESCWRQMLQGYMLAAGQGNVSS